MSETLEERIRAYAKEDDRHLDTYASDVVELLDRRDETIDTLCSENTRLTELNRAMRDALEEYANDDNWTICSDDGSEPDLWHGNGAGPSIAASALKDLQNVKLNST